MNERKPGLIKAFFNEVDLREAEMKGEEFFNTPKESFPERKRSKILRAISETVKDIVAVISGEDEHYGM